jgi:hypothetical protein
LGVVPGGQRLFALFEVAVFTLVYLSFNSRDKESFSDKEVWNWEDRDDPIPRGICCADGSAPG